MEDLRHYYEGEIASLKKQLTDMKNVIFQHEQQEGAVKGEIQKEFESLSQANLELSGKCDALEASKQLMQNQLKQATIRRQELESQCQQLMAANDIVDARSKELKRKKEETVAKMTEINGQREKLLAKCDLITKQKGKIYLVMIITY
jgi:chromosome segregation ATPase